MSNVSRAAMAALGVGLVVALALLAASWGPSQPAANRTQPPAYEIEVAEGEALDRHLFWTTSIELDSPPEQGNIEAVVPYAVRPQPANATGARIELNLTVNGQTAFAHVLHAGPGRVSQTLPLSQIDATTFQEGVNRVHAHAHLQRGPEARGSLEVAIGPLSVQAPTHATDRAGVLQAGPTVEEIQRAAIAGLLAAGAAGLAVHALVDREGDG